MPPMPLTDAKIKNAKPKSKPYKLTDGFGMYIEVTPAGGKYWRYKFRFANKESRLTLGRYPDTSISEARLRLAEARSKVYEGQDPRKRNAMNQKSNIDTFEIVAEDWLQNRKNVWSDIHFQNISGRLRRDILPFLGKTNIKDITARELLSVLRKVEERGAHETAHRLRSNCSEIYRYAIATDRGERDVAADLKGALVPVQKKHLAAIVEPDRLADLMIMIKGYRGTPVVRTALKLAALTFVRPGELRKAKWQDMCFKDREWRFTISKTKRLHIVPLAEQALNLLGELKPLTSTSDFVFPNARTKSKCMSNNAVLSALRVLGIPKEEMCGHGFRATARTILDEHLGIRPDLIEHQLSHSVIGPLGRAYNRTQFIKDRHVMMQTWADYIDALVSEPE